MFIHVLVYGNSMFMLVNATCCNIPTTLYPCLPRSYNVSTTVKYRYKTIDDIEYSAMKV